VYSNRFPEGNLQKDKARLNYTELGRLRLQSVID
jgi:hypothetical protein